MRGMMEGHPGFPNNGGKMIKYGSEFNELVLKDGTIVNFRRLRPAFQFQFSANASAEKIDFFATENILSSRFIGAVG